MKQNLKMKRPILIYSSLILLFTSCKETFIATNNSEPLLFGYESLSMTNTEEAFYRFYKEPTNGQILIQDNHLMGNKASTNFYVSAHHDKSIDMNTLRVNNVDVPKNINEPNSFMYHDQVNPIGIFGNDVLVDFNQNYNDIINIPDAIYADMSSINGVIAPGSTITWNDNPGNELGVVVLLKFDPYMQLDESFSSKPPVSVMVNAPDNGVYVLTPKMFKDVPLGALVEVTVTRGNYKMMISNDNISKCKLIAFSSSSGRGVYTEKS